MFRDVGLDFCTNRHGDYLPVERVFLLLYHLESEFASQENCLTNIKRWRKQYRKHRGQKPLELCQLLVASPPLCYRPATGKRLWLQKDRKPQSTTVLQDPGNSTGKADTVTEASSNIDLTFPASMDAQTSPIDPTPRNNNAAIRVPDRLHRHTIQTFREIKTNNREISCCCSYL
ncbi:hypothetical protein HanPI659440_Chr10g0382151 [Helianthus annuus]|nr:hypothetical protein HanPI659440_Chr10g0382151 [Helianthus annuus]